MKDYEYQFNLLGASLRDPPGKYMSDKQCIMGNEGFYLLPAGESFIIELLI